MKLKLKTSCLSLLFVLLALLPKETNAQCEADFQYTITDTTAIGQIGVIFFDQSFSNDSIFFWELSFGDGQTFNPGNPPIQGLNHTYDSAGIYEAILIIMDSTLCSDTIIKEINACATPVWPGDANADFIVNNLDILPLGLNFGESIAPRLVQAFDTSNWLPYCSVDDTIGFDPIIYVDCNGDGIIDSLDVTLIDVNYGRTHNKTTVLSPCDDPSDPPLFFVFPSSFLEAGNQLEVEIHLGTPSNPATDIYGLTFAIEYEKKLIDSVAGAWMNFDESLLVDSFEVSLDIGKDFYSSGRIEGGITKTNKIAKSFNGRIGSVMFVLEDDLIQKGPGDSIVERKFLLNFSDITLIDQSGNPDTVCAQSDSATVSFIIPGIDLIEEGIEVYPNPASDRLVVNSLINEEYRRISLFDNLGRLVMKVGNPDFVEILDVSGLAEGSYILQLEFADNVFQRKVVVY